MVMFIWSVVIPGPQGPLSTCHWSVVTPMPSPLIALVGEVGSAITPVPLVKTQTPVAGKVTALPASVVLLTGVQKLWSGPALAASWPSLNTVIVTGSFVLPHGPLSMVHWKVFVPIDSPLTVVVGSVASANEPVPAVTVQRPVAGNTTALPASVALVVGVQRSWSGPASAAAL